jgi:hypothetical protein
MGHGYSGGSVNVEGVWVPNASDASPLVRLWMPPPAAVDVALEQLSYSPHMRPDLLHIFICPHLMTH